MAKHRQMLVDQKCADLAEHFLSDVKGALPEDKCEMAEAIQRLCESWCATIDQSEKDRLEIGVSDLCDTRHLRGIAG